ncbi:hypothetical protein J6590_019927 [Homalodisca vitripennis]|nr:hypothetical protein J6590_019927 [Homalodisca vitripennis]
MCALLSPVSTCEYSSILLRRGGGKKKKFFLFEPIFYERQLSTPPSHLPHESTNMNIINLRVFSLVSGLLEPVQPVGSGLSSGLRMLVRV